MSSSPLTGQIRDARQLHRLREIRREAARREQAACRSAVEAAAEEMRALQSRIDHAQAKHQALVSWMHSQGSAWMVRLRSHANTAIDDLIQERERGQDALLAARKRWDAASQQAQAAQRRYASACAGVQVIEALLARLRAAQAREAEQRVERDSEPVRQGTCP